MRNTNWCVPPDVQHITHVIQNVKLGSAFQCTREITNNIEGINPGEECILKKLSELEFWANATVDVGDRAF